MSLIFQEKRRLFLATASILTLSDCSEHAIPDKCVKIVQGEALFVGADNCLSRLPLVRLKGYVSFGPEEAVFFDDRKKLQAFLDSNVPTEFLTWFNKGQWRPGLMQSSFSGKGNTIYMVDFDGYISRERGVYGHMGLYGAGVLVQHMHRYSMVRDMKGK